MVHKKTRYLMSSGLAFGEDRDMKKLSQKAANGWFLDSFAPLGFWLKQGDPKQLIYSVDYQHVTEENQEDYEGIFQASGWTHVCAVGNIHIFSAEPGTKPIYSDSASTVEKYKIGSGLLGKGLSFVITAFLIVTLAQAFFINEDTSIYLAQLVNILQFGLIILGVPMIMTYIAFRVRVRKALSKGNL